MLYLGVGLESRHLDEADAVLGQIGCPAQQRTVAAAAVLFPAGPIVAEESNIV
jgi:hypothetical protein